MAELFNDTSLFGSGSSSNNAPIEVIAEMLDYDYVNRCSSIDELKAILQTLKAGKFGKYPHLENTVKDKLDKLSNSEQKRKVQVISSSAANDEECGEKDALQDWLIGVDGSQGSADKADTTTLLPPVRAVTNTNLANVEVKPKVIVKKSNLPPTKSTSISKKASTNTTEVFRKEKLSTKEYFDRWDKFDVDKALAAVDDSDEEEDEAQPKKPQIVVEPKVVEKEPSSTKQFHRMAITEVDDAVADEDDEIEEVYTPGAAAELESTQLSSLAQSKALGKDDKSSTKDSQTSNTVPNDTTTKAPDSSWQKIGIVETSDNDKELVDEPRTSSSSMRRVDIVEETLTDNELDSEKFKSEGNTAMNEKRYSDAVRFYTLALDTNPDNTLALANRSAAYIKLEDWGNAIIDSTIVLSLESNNTKLLYRRGLANLRLGNTEEALVDFEHALTCQQVPKDQRKLLKKKVTACKKMLESMKDEMKEEVVGGDDECNSAKKKTKKKSRDSQALAF